MTLRGRLTEAIALAGMRPPLSVSGRTRIPLRGKRVLITGSSSGIGEAGAEQFAAEGAEVILVARRADLLDAVAARITARGGTGQISAAPSRPRRADWVALGICAVLCVLAVYLEIRGIGGG